MKQDPLNTMLQHWADRHTAKRAQLQSLEARIRQDVDGEYPRLPASPPPGRHLSLRAGTFWFIAGAAALAVLQALLPWSTMPARQPLPTTPAILIRQEGDRPPTTQALFGEATELFRGRLRWVAETDDKVHVELAPQESVPSQSSTIVQVRFVAVLSHPEGGWTREWTATVITDGEDLISLPLPGGGKVELWASQIDTGLIQTDMRMMLVSPPASASLSKVLTPGVSQLCLSLGSADGELRIYQIVSPVNVPTAEPQA